MIIDTESEEGKSLVALAKFGHWVINSDFDSKYWPEDASRKLQGLGLTEVAHETRSVTTQYVRNSSLAKLPEGI